MCASKQGPFFVHYSAVPLAVSVLLLEFSLISFTICLLWYYHIATKDVLLLLCTTSHSTKYVAFMVTIRIVYIHVAYISMHGF